MKFDSIRSGITRAIPLIVLATPLLFFWVYGMWLNPSENYYINDAEFPYFVNSLAVFKGGTYRYVDHPGTPVELLGSAILGLTFPFLSNAPEGFVFYHLQNPGVFFSLTHYFLIPAHFACIMMLFFTARTSNSFYNTTLAAALATMYFAIHGGSLNASMIWNHNSFSFPLGTLLSIWLFKTAQKGNGTSMGIPTATLIGLGIGAGILASFTIYLLAWLAGILTTIGLYYLLKRLPITQLLAAAAITGFSGAVGFLLANLPVLNKLPEFFNFVFKIFTHDSNYLAVPEQESTLTRIYNNSLGLGNTLPALYIAAVIVLILVFIALFVWNKKIPEKAGTWSVIGGLTAQTLLLLFVLLDRPSRDAYFLSLAGTLPVLLMAVLIIYEYHPGAHKVLGVITSLLALIGVVNTTSTAISTHKQEIASLASAEIKVSEAINDYALQSNRDPQQIMVLWMHDTYSTCWGLRLGNAKAGKVFNAELDTLCPNQYQLNSELRVVLPDQSHRLSEVDWDIIFTCEKWSDDLIEYNPSIIIEPQPDINWTCGNMVIAYRNKNP